MGWHYILELECIILPEFLDFIENRYLCDFGRDYAPWQQDLKDYIEEKNVDSLKRLPEFQVSLLTYWVKLNINMFYKYELSEGGIFKCRIEKKVTWHDGDLWDDYLLFVRNIIVPITSNIIKCRIESDDFGEIFKEYSDHEMRKH